MFSEWYISNLWVLLECSPKCSQACSMVSLSGVTLWLLSVASLSVSTLWCHSLVSFSSVTLSCLSLVSLWCHPLASLCSRMGLVLVMVFVYHTYYNCFYILRCNNVTSRFSLWISCERSFPVQMGCVMMQDEQWAGNEPTERSDAYSGQRSAPARHYPPSPTFPTTETSEVFLICW